ncbi:hypothetical protein L6452_27519 [Arctium lappa]|uniref:Uncharacterized protein n=1 Tax=Arctium lappa TaxID=4217 RepID=A0ACB8ZX99_ARCLA|nr:hypothetical protein L6452_27519 [Arctium lappa]
MLLYVESTECKQVTVEHVRPTTLGWNFDLLKKRESSELEDEGFGGSSLLENRNERPSTRKTFTPTHVRARRETKEDGDLVREEDIKIMDDKITLFMTAKWETEKLLETLMAKHPNDELSRISCTSSEIFSGMISGLKVVEMRSSLSLVITSMHTKGNIVHRS